MGQAARFGDAELEADLVAAVVVADQGAAPPAGGGVEAEEVAGVLPGTALGEFDGVEARRAVAPDVGPVGLALAGLDRAATCCAQRAGWSGRRASAASFAVCRRTRRLVLEGRAFVRSPVTLYVRSRVNGSGAVPGNRPTAGWPDHSWAPCSACSRNPKWCVAHCGHSPNFAKPDIDRWVLRRKVHRFRPLRVSATGQT
jgi:hypothetical protein